jgi:hypothetical protein
LYKISGRDSQMNTEQHVYLHCKVDTIMPQGVGLLPAANILQLQLIILSFHLILFNIKTKIVFEPVAG